MKNEMTLQTLMEQARYCDDLVRLAGQCAAAGCDVLMRDCLRKAERCAEFSSDHCRIAEAWHRWGYGARTEIARSLRKAEESALYPADFREITQVKSALSVAGSHGWFSFYPAA